MAGFFILETSVTVLTENRTVIRAGNGVATEFAFSFPVPSSDTIKVTRIDSNGSQTVLGASDFEVDLMDAGGLVRHPINGVALPVGASLVIERTLPLTQETDLTNHGAFFAETHEQVFDRLTMQIQQVSDPAERALKVSSGETVPDLPSATERAGKFLHFDASGMPATALDTETLGALGAIASDVTVLADAIPDIAAHAASAEAAAVSTAADLAAARLAAEESGISTWYQSYAEMLAASELHAEGDVVGVFDDEITNGLAASYRRENGDWVYKLGLYNGSAANTWYVGGETASDSNSGQLPDDAFATLAAVKAVLQNGDTVKLRRRYMWREDFDLVDYDFVTVEPFGSGALPIISGKDAITAWTLHPGSAQTWTGTVEVAQGFQSRAYAGLFEDGDWMTQVTVGTGGDDQAVDEAGAIAYVEATPGTYYFAGPGDTANGWDAGTKTYYMHPSDSGDPNTNGKSYEAFARAYTLRIGNHSVAKHIFCDGGFHHDGIGARDGCLFEDVVATRSGRHIFLTQQSVLRRCHASKMNQRYPGAYFHTNPSTLLDSETRWEQCRAIGDPGDPNDFKGTAFFAHGTESGLPTVRRLVYVDCEARNVGSVHSAGEVNEIYVVGLRAENFLAFLGSVQPLAKQEVIGCRAVGGQDSFFMRMNANTGNIAFRDCYFECRSQQFLESINGLGGSLTFEDCTIFHAAENRPGSASRFLSINDGPTSDIRLMRTKYIGLNRTNNDFIRLETEPAWTVDQFLYAAPNYQSAVVSVGTPVVTEPLASKPGVQNAFTIDSGQIVGDWTQSGGFRLASGSWTPRAPVISAAAHSKNGAQQPRRTLAAGAAIHDFGVNVTSSYPVFDLSEEVLGMGFGGNGVFRPAAEMVTWPQRHCRIPMAGASVRQERMKTCTTSLKRLQSGVRWSPLGTAEPCSGRPTLG